MRAVLPVLVLLAAGCAETSDGVTVDVLDRTFAPDALTVANGTSVLFRNVDDEEHTATLAVEGEHEGILDERRIPAQGSASLAFPEAGTFVVYCRYHGDAATGQRMTVTVT